MADVTSGQKVRIYTGSGPNQYYDIPVEQSGIGMNALDQTVSGLKTFSGNNVHSGNNAFSGNNTHTGLETFTGIVVMGPNSGQIVATSTTLSKTEIVGTAAGDLGHANGAVIVAAPAATHTYVFIGMNLIYDFGVAAYTGGADDLVVCYGAGGATLSGATTSANLLGAAGDKQVFVYPLTTAGNPLTAGAGINLKSTAWTDPGTAVGTLRIITFYRVIEHGL